MPETVPADIATAIQDFTNLTRPAGHEFSRTREADIASARAALDAVILKHLRDAERCCDSYARENQRLSDAYAEMKAALERIERGV